MTEWVEKAYKELWNSGDFDTRDVDEGDRQHSEEIEQADPAVLEAQLRSVVRTINTTVQSAADWVKYKYSILERESEFGVVVFRWVPQTNLAGAPYIGVDINWELFEPLNRIDRCRACFILYLAFTNGWFADTQLPSVGTDPN